MRPLQPTDDHPWGEPPWQTLSLPAAPLPERADVVVVGAGFTGLAAAFRLARAGARVAVLDAGQPGSGASGRTGGIVLEGTAAGALAGTASCIPALRRLVHDAGIDCDLQLEGCHEIAHRHGPEPPAGPLAWRDADAWLGVEGEVAGGTLDPGSLVAGLVRAALDAGASIHPGVRVRALPPEPACDAVLLATGAYASEAGLVDPPQGFRSALTLALCTTALGRPELDALGLGDGRPFYTTDRPYLWGRILRDGRVVFGAGLVAARGGVLDGIDLNAGEAAERSCSLEARVRGLHPVLEAVGIERRWGGPVSFREGALPILARHPVHDRTIVAGAYAGHGVALSARVAELAAHALLQGAALPAWGGIRARRP